MNKILLIWDDGPNEETRIYYLEVDDDTSEKICLCHEQYLGGSIGPNETLSWLYNYLEDKDLIDTSTQMKIDGFFNIVTTGQVA